MRKETTKAMAAKRLKKAQENPIAVFFLENRVLPQRMQRRMSNGRKFFVFYELQVFIFVLFVPFRGQPLPAQAPTLMRACRPSMLV
ncbi:MAG: hypothetical protein PHX38_04500 [Sulfuricella sp.]|nr:hypothetical protein [Sulfuricella sp.]